MSQKRFFVPVISHNIFSSLFESGNNSTSLNSCLPASNVTFLFVFFQSYVCQLSLCPFHLLGESSLPVALLVFGVRSGFRGGLQMPVSLMLVQASWSAVKLRGVSFGTPMRWNETRRSIVGSSCLGWFACCPRLVTERPKSLSRRSGWGYSKLSLKMSASPPSVEGVWPTDLDYTPIFQVANIGCHQEGHLDLMFPESPIVTWKVLLYEQKTPKPQNPNWFNNLLTNEWELRRRVFF